MNEATISPSTVPLYRGVIFTILWNAMTMPATYVFARGIWRDPSRASALLTDWPIYIWLLFPIIGIVAAIRAVRLVAGALAYKHSSLAVRGSAAVGRSLDGMIRVPGLQLREGQRIRLTLRCELLQRSRNIVATRGRNQSVTLTDKWKNQTFVSSTQVHASGDGAIVPVHFDIPATCEPTGTASTDIQGRTNRARWWLVARAEPRSLWTTTFEVPVAAAEAPLTREP